jgi:hypothetical protein
MTQFHHLQALGKTAKEIDQRSGVTSTRPLEDQKQSANHVQVPRRCLDHWRWRDRRVNTRDAVDHQPRQMNIMASQELI